MTPEQKENLERLAQLLVRYRSAERFPEDAWGDAKVIHRYARMLTRLAEKDCNEGLSPPEQAAEKRYQTIINLIVAHYEGCSVKFDGDPRGYCVKVFFPGGESNTWGGKEEGFGVG